MTRIAVRFFAALAVTLALSIPAIPTASAASKADHATLLLVSLKRGTAKSNDRQR